MPLQNDFPPSSTHLTMTVAKSVIDWEVKRQLDQLPQRVQQYIEPHVVTLHALDALPPLYLPAVTVPKEPWWHYRYQSAKHKVQVQIAQAVRQALVSVRYTVFAGLPKEQQVEYLEGWL